MQISTMFIIHWHPKYVNRGWWSKWSTAHDFTWIYKQIRLSRFMHSDHLKANVVEELWALLVFIFVFFVQGKNTV